MTTRPAAATATSIASAAAPTPTPTPTPAPAPTPTSTLAPGAASARAAAALGRAYARHGCRPPLDVLPPGHPVRTAWEATCAGAEAAPTHPGRWLRAWLRLRLQAWQRGVELDPLLLQPALLRRIDVASCPVTGERLTDDQGSDRDATIVALDPRRGWTVGNLAMVSRRAAEALALRSVAEMQAIAGRIDAGGPVAVAGLDARQWTRAAVLAAFATPLPHGRAASLPLLLLPSPRLPLANPAQALQLLLSLQLTRLGHPRRCAALADWLPSGDARHAFHAFQHALLARWLAARRTTIGRSDSADDERARLAELWRDRLVQRRWERLVQHLDAPGCAQLVEQALARGLAGAALHWLGSTEQADDAPATIALRSTPLPSAPLPSAPLPSAPLPSASRPVASLPVVSPPVVSPPVVPPPAAPLPAATLPVAPMPAAALAAAPLAVAAPPRATPAEPRSPTAPRPSAAAAAAPAATAAASGGRRGAAAARYPWRRPGLHRALPPARAGG